MTEQSHYEVRDLIPAAEIDAITAEAAHTWLERNGWVLDEDYVRADGERCRYYDHPAGYYIYIGTKEGERLPHAGRHMAALITMGAAALGVRTHVVLDELRLIADWQKRVANARPLAEGERCFCATCERKLEVVWEAPPVKAKHICPLCYQRSCLRALNHTLACGGPDLPRRGEHG